MKEGCGESIEVPVDNGVPALGYGEPLRYNLMVRDFIPIRLNAAFPDSVVHTVLLADIRDGGGEIRDEAADFVFGT